MTITRLPQTARENRTAIRHMKRLIGSIWSDLRVDDQHFEPITRLLITFQMSDFYYANEFVYRPMFMLDTGELMVPAIDLEDLLVCENNSTNFRRIA